MEPPSPARLYAALVGGSLVILGLVGFFSDLSWFNFLYVGSGALGLVLASFASRYYALSLGTIYTALAIWDFSNRGWLHLAVGLLGLAAFASSRGSLSTHDVQKEPRDELSPLEP
ncbi:MAG TPA: hypothetical protein VH275_09480 [Solirubrobacterales bacterium]|jgi:hypothetical protein|nr:hypothetical protein [Solirubrobacterales bacterium]